MRSNALIWCDFFNVLCMSFLPKLTLNFIFCIFQRFLHFLNLQRALFLVFLKQMCHQNGYWMLLTYIVFILSKKDLFSFSFFWIFLLILKDIPNSSIFRPILVYDFFSIFTNVIDFWIMGGFWYYFQKQYTTNQIEKC